MKTLLSGNYAIAQFDDVAEKGKKQQRLHVYVKSGTEWIYQSFITLRIPSGYAVMGVTIRDKHAIIQLSGAAGEKNFFYQLNGNAWVFQYEDGVPAFSADSPGSFFKAASRNYINRIYSLFRIPVPMAIGA